MPPMASPRSRQAARLRERRRRAQRRARRLVIGSALAILGVVTLLLTAFGSSGSSGAGTPEPASFAAVPADSHHFFMSKTASTIQVHGMGPFAITYVNPADDPRTKKTN